MKRTREVERRSEIKCAIEELSMFVKLKPPDGDNYDSAQIPTKSFLCICNLILQVLDKIGPTMAVLRQDIYQNIQRIEVLCESDSAVNSNLVEMLKKETSEGTAKKGNTSSKAFVWLTRTLDFTVALLLRLSKDPGQNMEQAVEESYNITLKPWHGWISSAAFKVALKLVPDRKTFFDILMAKDESYKTLTEDIQNYVTFLAPMLEHIHSTLRFYDLDRLKSI
ncbi:glycolipid transfer protein 3-like isoform X2 [Tripterygium wilfordii]|uniref:glycolipid transfer protein 3-like isoform X2 n=1 Tax=Tripterygium wilfordii TaxID=458696 RepID=UPI0018F7ECD1|nr:glycolipid transfer protein 3-like isoform X2 [Tripterygium wilfordii]